MFATTLSRSCIVSYQRAVTINEGHACNANLGARDWAHRPTRFQIGLGPGSLLTVECVVGWNETGAASSSCFESDLRYGGPDSPEWTSYRVVGMLDEAIEVRVHKGTNEVRNLNL